MQTYIKPSVAFLNIRISEKVSLIGEWVNLNMTNFNPSCYLKAESGALPDFARLDAADK